MPIHSVSTKVEMSFEHENRLMRRARDFATVHLEHAAVHQYHWHLGGEVGLHVALKQS